MSLTSETPNGLLFIKDTIVGYKGAPTVVTIDSELIGVDSNGKEVKSLTIKSIANNVFENKIVSINLPDTIENIGDEAFANNNLMSVNLPNAIQNIGAGAFANNNLMSIKLPNSLKFIGENAFYNNKLKEVDFSNTKISKISTRSFAKNFINNIVLNTLIDFIGIGAFQENQLSTSTINNIFKNNTTITTIERGAFAYNNITLNVAGYTPHNIIYLPKNLQYIGVGAFEVREKINFGFGSIDAKVKYFDQVGLTEEWVSFTIKVINENGETYYLRSYDLFNVRVVNQQYYDLG